MADLTRVYSEAFLIDEGTLGESARKWFEPQLSVDGFESFRSSIRLSGSPASQWCEVVVLYASIYNEDLKKFEEVPHALWRSFDEFKQEFIIDKRIPNSRFIVDETTKSNYQHVLKYAS